MRKKLFTLAIAAFVAMGFAVSAQQAPQNKMYTPQTFTDYAFEGVLLDLPQQQRIDSLHAAIRTPDMKRVNAISMCPESMCPDSAKLKCQGQQRPRAIRPGGNMGGVMPGVEYVAKVKEILTPEQFDTFMANIQSMPEKVINNLLPEMPQPGQRANRPAKARNNKDVNCTAGNCQKQNCNSAENCQKQNCNSAENCQKQNCNSAENCQKQNCNSSENCTKSNCHADKGHKNKNKGNKKENGNEKQKKNK